MASLHEREGERAEKIGIYKGEQNGVGWRGNWLFRK